MMAYFNHHPVPHHPGQFNTINPGFLTRFPSVPPGQPTPGTQNQGTPGVPGAPGANPFFPPIGGFPQGFPPQTGSGLPGETRGGPMTQVDPTVLQHFNNYILGGRSLQV